MSRNPLLLGIDLGTSGVKAGLFAPDGRLVGLGRGSGYRFSSPRPGWSECDAERWWPAIVAAVRAAIAAADAAADGGGTLATAGAATAVAGIGFSTFFPTLVPIDAAGAPLRAAILYSDQRAIEQARAIARAIPRRRYERITGNRLAVGNTVVTSIQWLRDREPTCCDGSRVLALANTVIVRRMTGEAATDWTTASLSGLVDIRDPSRWDPGLCAATEVPVAKLPRILGPAEVAGSLAAGPAAELGLPAGIPVVCGAGDTVASALGAGAIEPGAVLYSAGSTDCVTIVGDRPGRDRDWIGVAHVPRGRWVAIGANASGGLSLDWLAGVLGGVGVSTDVGELLRLADEAPAGRVVFLPYLQGERTPVWDPLARGLFLGLAAGTTRGEMARAVLEGSAFSLRHMLESPGGAGARDGSPLPCVGGGTRSAAWNRIRADVLQRPLEVLRFQETAALGAALMAGIGAGVHGSAAEAVAAAVGVRAVDRVEPDPARAELYDRLYRVYREAYARNRPLMHDLAR